jgi:O-glycosyl hydrolase
METVIGFAAGFLVGTQEGKDGLERLRASLRAIAASPQTRQAATSAVTIATAIAKQAAAKGFGGAASGMAGLVLHRAAAGRQPSRTA